MQFWFDLFSLMFNTMLFSFFTPFFWLVIFIVFMQYRRSVAMEKKLFGRSINNVTRQTLYSVFFGIIGGLFGSFFLLLLGISLDNIGIVYLWPIAILLFLLNPRFLCFAYAGGILAMLSLLLQTLHPYYPFLSEIPVLGGLLKLHLPGLLALVGILHLTEAFLILMSGHRGASPIFLKTPSGKIVGAFSMQRFWPLPLMGLWALVVAETAEMFVGGIAMPQWWPLLGTVMNPGGGEKVVYLMVPLVAGLGYSDLALSSHPRGKRVKTAWQLSLYSILLALAALASVRYPLIIFAAALVAPLGHEYLIKIGNKAEFSAPPLFHSGADGLQVMALFPGGAAERSGLKPGDRILELNGFRVRNELEFWQLLSYHYGRALLKLRRGDTLLSLTLELQAGEIQEKGGIIFSPGAEAAVYVELQSNSLWEKLRRRLG